jgi:hypothetical protein
VRHRTGIVLLGLALFLAFPSWASADSIHRFRVKDTGSRIAFGVTVCTNDPHSVRFFTYLRPSDGGFTHRATARDRDDEGCWRHHLSVPDEYVSDLWIARMKVAIGGRVFKTRWREFVID